MLERNKKVLRCEAGGAKGEDVGKQEGRLRNVAGSGKLTVVGGRRKCRERGLPNKSSIEAEMCC